jgi:O-antigen/teichoic acid export membrane protein
MPADAVSSPNFTGLATRVARASAVYALANFSIRALNFLLLPVYTHFLSPADYGILTMTETVAMFLLLVFGLGFDGSIQRLYFQHAGNADELRRFNSSVLKFMLAMEALVLLLAFTLGPLLLKVLAPNFGVPFRYFACAIATAAATQFVQYRLILFQVERRPGAFAILSFFSFALTASITLVLITIARLGVAGMLVGKLSAALFVFSIAIYFARSAFRTQFDWHKIRETLSMGAMLVPHQLMAGGLIAGDRFILQHYRDLREIGLYAIAYTFGMIMSLVTLSLNQAWMPVYYDLARSDEGQRRLGRICSELFIGMAAVACFGALIAQDFIARFLNERYVTAGRVVPWIIGAYLAHAMFSIFSLAVLQGKRTQWLMLVSFSALTVNTALNFALIPVWGMYGAAYATAAAYVVEAVVMYFVAQRAYRLNYDLRRMTAGSGIFVAALFVTQVPWAVHYRPVVMIIAGITCLGLLSMLGLKRTVMLLVRRTGELRP